MATAFSSSVSHGRKDSSTSLRRQLSNSTPLLKTITKDLCTGWLSPTSEKASSKHDNQSTYHHKPRHAGRDALKTTSPKEWKDSLEPCNRDIDIRSRQDSLTPVKHADMGKLGHTGLVPDYSLDCWSMGWDVAYERRSSVLHGNRRSPCACMSSAFTISEEQARDIRFGSLPKRVRSRSGGHFVSPAPSRRGSEVPSLVYSEEDGKASSLGELEEESEEDVEEEEKKRWGKVFAPEEIIVAPPQIFVGKAAMVRI